VSYSNFLFIFFSKNLAYCANAKWRLRLRLQLFNCVFAIMSISRQPNFQLYIKIYIYSKVIITNTFSIARFCITQIAFKPNRLEAFRRRESRLSIALVPSCVLFIMQQFRTIERLARAVITLLRYCAWVIHETSERTYMWITWDKLQKKCIIYTVAKNV